MLMYITLLKRKIQVGDDQHIVLNYYRKWAELMNAL